MIEVINYKGNWYPKFQSSGFAARFSFPFAAEVCKGIGVDVGPGKREWVFPGAYPIEPAWDDMAIANVVAQRLQGDNSNTAVPRGFHATNFPNLGPLDYVFSSHCLEHVPNWVDALDHWYDNLKDGGVLFLYLPHPDQEYWLPYNNRKHIHCLPPELIEHYLWSKGYQKVFVSERDLNHSYIAMGEKMSAEELAIVRQADDI